MCVCVSVRARVFKTVRNTNLKAGSVPRGGSKRSRAREKERPFGAISITNLPREQFRCNARVITLERWCSSFGYFASV